MVFGKEVEPTNITSYFVNVIKEMKGKDRIIAQEDGKRKRQYLKSEWLRVFQN